MTKEVERRPDETGICPGVGVCKHEGFASSLTAHLAVSFSGIVKRDVSGCVTGKETTGNLEQHVEPMFDGNNESDLMRGGEVLWTASPPPPRLNSQKSHLHSQ